jgi:hypothetical protein
LHQNISGSIHDQTIMDHPAMEPPEGVQPNFEDPPNHNELGFATVTPAFTVAAIVVLLRVYAKVRIIKRLDLEDCMWPRWNQVITSR